MRLKHHVDESGTLWIVNRILSVARPGRKITTALAVVFFIVLALQIIIILLTGEYSYFENRWFVAAILYAILLFGYFFIRRLNPTYGPWTPAELGFTPYSFHVKYQDGRIKTIEWSTIKDVKLERDVNLSLKAIIITPEGHLTLRTLPWDLALKLRWALKQARTTGLDPMTLLKEEKPHYLNTAPPTWGVKISEGSRELYLLVDEMVLRRGRRYAVVPRVDVDAVSIPIMGRECAFVTVRGKLVVSLSNRENIRKLYEWLKGTKTERANESGQSMHQSH